MLPLRPVTHRATPPSNRDRCRQPPSKAVIQDWEVGTESEQLIKLRYQNTTFCDIYH